MIDYLSHVLSSIKKTPNPKIKFYSVIKPVLCERLRHYIQLDREVLWSP